jgi:hypothetical protein
MKTRLAVPLQFAVDIAAMDHRYRAKRTGQTPAEYADPFERYHRPTSWKTWAAWLCAAALVVGAIVLGAM